ncbi:aminotransferase class IV family protein [Ruegeria arenilitoris]|uniref:aminotransferase class IV family protein n=1 Tax=Ruegeria arenilitoris TaxID=1173585 RepID=UPI00147A3F38|nr:aminotransferase class IV family protein [Ruegeria arenilitoris]
MESPFCEPIPEGTRLIETFRYVPGKGFQDLSRHLRRMERSARALDFPFDRMGEARKLENFRAETVKRCRLSLGADGDVEFTETDLTQPNGRWVVEIADQRLRSGDPWLQHKTTQRAVYDEARRNMPEGVDELLFLNERDELCEGTITNLFVKLHRGGYVTPPLSSGCLPGVLRQRLLDKGRVSERVVTLQDLRHAQFICVANSLRGEIAVDYRGPRGPLV